MKFFQSLLLMLCFSILLGCATDPNDKSMPGLDDFQTRSLPSGSTDAALTAHTTY